jgi:hypothetical protein
VSSTLTETSRWMDQNADLFRSLDADEAMTSTLPTLPREPEQEGPPPIPRPRRREHE